MDRNFVEGIEERKLFHVCDNKVCLGKYERSSVEGVSQRKLVQSSQRKEQL